MTTMQEHAAADFANIGRADFGTSIDYQHIPTATIDTSTGDITAAATTDSGITVVRHRFSLKAVADSGGRLRIGDVRYRILVDDLTSAPSGRDQIVDGSATLKVIEWTKDPAEARWIVVARRLKDA